MVGEHPLPWFTNRLAITHLAITHHRPWSITAMAIGVIIARGAGATMITIGGNIVNDTMTRAIVADIGRIAGLA
jgi:hypothetical protein